MAATAQDKKSDPEPEGLVERVVDAYIAVETAKAKRTRQPLDPLADALARVRNTDRLAREKQELPSDHPLVVAGQAQRT